MKTAVFTQDGEIIFCDNLFSISIMSAEGEDIYAIVGLPNTLQSDNDDPHIILGIFNSLERTESVLNEMKKWLLNGIHGLFEMPPTDE